MLLIAMGGALAAVAVLARPFGMLRGCHKQLGKFSRSDGEGSGNGGANIHAVLLVDDDADGNLQESGGATVATQANS